MEATSEHLINALSAQFTGRRIYVPHEASITASHPIAEAIGLDPAKLLGRLYGGTTIDVPTNLARKLSTRNAALFDDHASGQTIQMIADKYGITWRHVFRILAKRRK